MRNHSINDLRHSVSARRRISTLIYHLLMLIVSFAMLYPVLWLVASSFKPNGDIFSTATSLIPQNFTLEHYKIGWKGFGGYSFTTFFKNSLFTTAYPCIAIESVRVQTCYNHSLVVKTGITFSKGTKDFQTIFMPGRGQKGGFTLRT